jgi:ceramide glucosyltransferase
MTLYWSTVTAMLVAIVGCGYVAAAAILVDRFVRRRMEPHPAATPGVTILKPLHGDEPGLFDNLASFCDQSYQGSVQMVCGVRDPKDGAIPVFTRLQNSFPARDLDLVVDATFHGSNRKVSNLANMATRIRHDVVVVSDSDMQVDPDYLSRVVAALQEPGVGAVTCLYYGDPAASTWSQLSALAINAHFLPGVVVGLALGWARPCFGSTIALRRETLAEIGGFRAVADRLADDYAIGQALQRHGRKISIPPLAIAHRCTHMSARELWKHELRWARTIRSIDPLGYAGTIVTHAFPWALAATVLAAGSDLFVPALGITFAAVASRIALLRRVERAYGLAPQDPWLVPARDLLSFVVFVWSFLGRDVSWKGRRYRYFSGRIADAESPQQ